MKHLLTFIAVLVLRTFFCCAQAQTLVTYPFPSSIWTQSVNYTLKVNGTTVPVSGFAGEYDIAHFSLSGSATVELTSLSASSISSYRISPQKLNIPGTTSGSKLTFTLPGDGYYIVAINGQRPVVIAADPLETNVPASSGTGIFNVTAAPFNADRTGSNKATAGIQAAIDAANAYTGGQAIVYIPSGVYLCGNIVLKSNVHVYMEGGAIIRCTGIPSDYTTHFRKTSQNRDGTWFIYTATGADNVKLYGRGTVDGNGYYMANTQGYANHVLVPLACTNFTVDGITFRDSGSWGIVVARSNNLVFRNYKHFNAMNTGEDDCIDINESQNVLVQHSIAIALDDPYSTKTWNVGDININWPGPQEPVDSVVFDDCIAYTHCVAFKVGQGAYLPQSNITFKNGVVYGSSAGIGIHHRAGAAEFSNITFDNIDIEGVTSSCIGQSWAILQTDPTGGGGPVNNVKIKNINVRSRGGSNVIFRGVSNTAGYNNVTFENIHMLDNARPVSSLEEINNVEREYTSNVYVIPGPVSARRQAEYNNSRSGTTSASTTDVDGGRHIAVKNGEWIGFRKVEFGTGTTLINLRYAAGGSGGTIEVRKDSASGPLLGSANLPTTSGSWTAYTTVPITITNTTGTQHIYLKFTRTDALTIANVNWFEVIPTVAPVSAFYNCDYGGTVAERQTDHQKVH